MRYKASDFYVSRIPLLPMENFFNQFNTGEHSFDRKEWMKNQFEFPPLAEALAISSWESYQALTRLKDDLDIKDSEKVFSTLLKYYIRATTRPTPYGLFSGVSIGTFKECNSIYVDECIRHTKRARVDMGWLYSVIHKIESVPEIKEHLYVRFNSSVYIHGAYAYTLHQTCLCDTPSSAENESSIRFTRKVQAVKDFAHEFIRYSDLRKKVAKDSVDIPDNIVDNFLNQLFVNEYLISELRPPMINTDPLSYVISTLTRLKNIKEANYWYQNLLDIQKDISEYNQTTIGCGISLFQNIISKMKEIQKSPNYIQIDMKTATKQNSLQNSSKRELEDFIDAMLRIAPEHKIPDEYASYIAAFIEKYGLAAEVPVLELLDPDNGLGIPADFKGRAFGQTSHTHRTQLKGQTLKNFLRNKTTEALKTGKCTIEITATDIDKISNAQEGSKSIDDFIPSFELFLVANPCNYSADVPQNYKYTLSPVAASSGIGKGLGRFCDMLEEKDLTYLRESTSELKKCFSEHYIFAEISELPTYGRTSNVAITESNYDYQIALSSNECAEKKVISLDSLYISANSNGSGLVIRSKEIPQKVIAVSTNMLNPKIGSKVYRFLKDVSSQYRYNPIIAIQELIAVDDVYAPRITYKNFIIRPQSWIIRKENLNLLDNTEKTFQVQFDSYKKRWNIPRFVLITQADNRLLVDLDDTIHFHELFKIFQKNSEVKLVESVYSANQYPTYNSDGQHYVTEIIVPFILNRSDLRESTQTKFLSTVSDVNSNAMSVSYQNSNLLIAEKNWLYFKLYGSVKHREALLTEIYDTLKPFLRNGTVSGCFFIRYADPEPHVRIRIQVSSYSNVAEVLMQMMHFFESVRNRGLLTTVVLDTYQREVSRYGGIRLIDSAENYFFYDSLLVMQILHQKVKNNAAIKFEYIGISYLMMVFREFGLNDEQLEEFLNTQCGQNDFREQYQKDRKQYMKATESQEFQGIFNEIGSDVGIILNSLLKALSDYIDKISEIDKRGELTNSKINIAKSIVHMFCNRLVGNNLWERKIYALSRHSLHDYNNFLKHYKSM